MELSEDAIKSLTDLGVQIQRAEKDHRDQFISKETKDENMARTFIDGVISSVYLKTNEPISDITSEGEYQLMIGASFIRTHLALNDTILDGHIMESQCLLRKQVELLARLQELESKSVKEVAKKTPNINAINWNAGRMYGAQSEVAHFSRFEVGEALLDRENFESHARIGLFPKYSQNSVYAMSSRLFLGVQFSLWFTDKLAHWYPRKDFSILQKQTLVAVEIAAANNILTKHEEG
ncbi:hypothetical protein N9891_01525 [bacterium]|nr:hypothetical protein [bacterium]